MTILCLQAGNVNTGAFDPAAAICPAARAAGAWVHVDGAFGLWAAASLNIASSPKALSWPIHGPPTATSGQTSATTAALRWYANGSAERRHVDPGCLPGAWRESRPSNYSPELSGERGGGAVGGPALARPAGHGGACGTYFGFATRFAVGLKAAGFEVLNEVVINQVLVSFGSPERRYARWHGCRRRNLLVRFNRLAGAHRHAHQRVKLGTTQQDVDRSLQP